MQEKRRKDQVISQILALCLGGVNKTKIVYQVNLNFKTANAHLDLLLKKGLLEATQGNSPIYKTTPKGEKALEILQKAEEITS